MTPQHPYQLARTVREVYGLPPQVPYIGSRTTRIFGKNFPSTLAGGAGGIAGRGGIATGDAVGISQCGGDV